MTKQNRGWDAIPNKDWDTSTEYEKLYELGVYNNSDGDGDTDISIGSIQIDNY